MMLPRDLRYTREHEWVRVEGDRMTIGVTDFAQSQLGDVVFVELPAVGEDIEAGATLASIESVKAVSDVYAPVKGHIVAVNDDLEHSPEYVNQDPYGKGWIAVIESDQEQLSGLLTPEEYEPLTERA
ncbi:MAG: glycine cleavage system protein GcvH [Patescibacteria group bacterium]